MFSARHVIRRLTRPSMLRTNTARVAIRSIANDAQTKSSNGISSSSPGEAMATLGALMGFAVSGAGIAMMEPKQKAPSSSSSSLSSSSSSADSPFQKPSIAVEDPNTPPPRPDLPTISLEDVAEHNDESSLWYTFRGAVYDLTFFINGHPGGTPVRSDIQMLTVEG